MRIGLNAQILTDGRTGVTRFAHNVIRMLPKIGRQHEFVIFGNSPDLKYQESNVVLVRTNDMVNSSTKRIIWEQTILSRLVQNYNLDLIFYPDHTASLFPRGAKQVIMLHDLAPFALPNTFNRMRRWYKQYAINKSIRVAEAIIVGSLATKAEAVQYFPEAVNKISVVQDGLERSIERVTDQTVLAGIRARYSIREPYLLCVGTLEARKNIVRLIKAFAKGRRNYGWTHHLVLVGNPGYGYDEIIRVMNDEKVKEFITITGYVKDDELMSFYTLADVFIYPSLYEGFGFPPLEAMKCGCPVIVSNSTSLPEVVGDAGIYLDPYDEDTITEKINCLMKDTLLRKNLVQKGRERCLQFTWEKTVKGILDVFAQI